MAITMDAIETLLKEIDFSYVRVDRYFALTFSTDTYRSIQDASHCFIAVEPSFEGRFLRVLAPHALVAKGPHVAALLHACAICQWHYPATRFEYDEGSGEVRPSIGFPIEDAVVTPAQLRQTVLHLVRTLENVYPTLKRALAEGIVGLPATPEARVEAEAILTDELRSGVTAEEKDAAQALLKEQAPNAPPSGPNSN